MNPRRRQSVPIAGVCLAGMALAAAGIGCSAASTPRTNRPPVARRAMIVINARVWTADDNGPEAEAFAVRDGRVVAVGPRRDIEATRGPDTRVIDAGGRRIIPGMIDSHLHLVSGGLSLSRLALRDVRNRDEFVASIAAQARTLRPGQWLLGRGWSTESWPDPTQPDRAWIDAVTGDRPALLGRMDGHAALANTAALRRAGIDERGPADPAGGTIERDATGRPTGILKESAIDLVARHTPQPTTDELVDAALAAMQHANRFGVTGVCTMSEWMEVEPLRRVHDSNRDTLRVAVYAMEEDWPSFAERVRAFPVADDRLWIAGFKAYMDGSLGSRTAYMREPFADRPDQRGLLSAVMSQPGRMAANFEAAESIGRQCAVHAIGDEANHLLLNMYEELALRRGPRDRRPRIEHAQHLRPEDIPRFAKLGVIASMQPFHKADDSRYAEQAIGPRRSRTSYAFRELLDAGAVLAFGSDWPVVSLNPFTGIQAAVTGRSLDGRVWMEHQNLTVEQSLLAYTRGAAYACGMEAKLGRIAPGFAADFVILETDPLTATPDALDKIRVHSTYVGGRCVWPAERT